MSGDLAIQKRFSDALELELQVFVDHHVEAVNQTQILWKSNQNFSITEISLKNSIYFLKSTFKFNWVCIFACVRLYANEHS